MQYLYPIENDTLLFLLLYWVQRSLVQTPLTPPVPQLMAGSCPYSLPVLEHSDLDLQIEPIPIRQV